MKAVHIILGLGLAFGLSACGFSDIVSRNSPMKFASGSDQTYAATRYNVRASQVTVPRYLVVSEKSEYDPAADIVWQGQPRGDRYMQVSAIFTDAFGMATAPMKDGPEVIVDVLVKRFHGITAKARSEKGGEVEMIYDLTLRDARTNEIIDGPREVALTTPATGGRDAIKEEQTGRSQRVAIIDALRASVEVELSRESEEIPSSRAYSPISLTPGHLLENVPLPL